MNPLDLLLKMFDVLVLDFFKWKQKNNYKPLPWQTAAKQPHYVYGRGLDDANDTPQPL